MFWRCNTFDQGLPLYLTRVIKLTDVCTCIRIERAVQYHPSTDCGRMSSSEQLMQMIKGYLGVHTINKWTLSKSPLDGLGLFATEDIAAGEVIFVDKPLIFGPRAGANLPRGCTVCSTLDSDTFFKCSSCALLLCSEKCQNTNVHRDDCNIISRWINKVPMEEVDVTIMSRSLAVIRVLLLNENELELLATLEAHKQPQHGFEVKALREYFEIPEEEEKLMLLACRIYDTNAYQMAVNYGKREMSMRGLYPVACRMNSICVPNVRYSFNGNNDMIVAAVKPIRAGSEINTCYSGLLWGTPARQMHLKRTKHFICKCERCADPTERGTLLSALKCFNNGCRGSLISTKPLISTAAWRCLECDIRIPSKNIFAVQNALGSMLAMLEFKSFNDLENFLLHRVTNFIPKTNQIVVDLQIRFIFGTEDIGLKELSESRLALKESLCRGVLRVVAALGLGDAHHRGLLLYHLHATLAERARRCPDLYEDLKPEIESTIEQAYNILRDDISAPPDLELRRRYLGPGSDKPHEERFFILDS
ncbi:SET domain-containing protein SmydA-8-like isoform X2 [Pectinophora gossypiella]|uniref:SET domain-containing protein SmydA-8-like isoform X2 n=1 Tax=Pectinophora gossypiella TaxID=13191 RepID=UPI00214E0645|nr:SET domain-containing protein SmydA-8-like isoform X2 [Pectinophora gossypiella]